jgi:hypothetical protein
MLPSGQVLGQTLPWAKQGLNAPALKVDCLRGWRAGLPIAQPDMIGEGEDLDLRAHIC